MIVVFFLLFIMYLNLLTLLGLVIDFTFCAIPSSKIIYLLICCITIYIFVFCLGSILTVILQVILPMQCPYNYFLVSKDEAESI